MSNNGALNAQQEKFARLLAEGMPQSRAYIEAGYKARGNSAEAHASALVRIRKVASRLNQLRAENAKASKVTVQSITKMLIAAYDLSITEKQAGAATQAAMGLAKLHGFLFDKQQVETVIRKPTADPYSPDEMTEEEWLERFG